MVAYVDELRKLVRVVRKKIWLVVYSYRGKRKTSRVTSRPIHDIIRGKVKIAVPYAAGGKVARSWLEEGVVAMGGVAAREGVAKRGGSQ